MRGVAYRCKLTGLKMPRLLREVNFQRSWIVRLTSATNNPQLGRKIADEGLTTRITLNQVERLLRRAEVLTVGPRKAVNLTMNGQHLGETPRVEKGINSGNEELEQSKEETTQPHGGLPGGYELLLLL